MAVHAAKQVVTGSRRSAASAGDPVLASMITAPDVPDWVVRRPRISELIAQGTRRCPVTVVTGPAGAGKTMALALWAAAEPGPVAWVRLDEYNTRPGAFWSYVVAALRRAGVALPGTLPGAARGETAEDLFLLRLASALAAQDPPVTLVLDDLHLITEPTILGGLDFLVRSVGPGLRLVAASRTDPLLPVHRYRLAGQVAEIRGADLAFSAAEAGLLLARHGCTLSGGTLDSLIWATEGWAAGLRLAAISLAAHPDPDRFVTELLARDSALTGYLAEEVFGTQPPEVRELLLRTSILGRVNAEAASELAGNRQAGRILAELAHANAFVQPAGGGWYRYHPLFAHMLRLTLRLDRPDQIASLHRQAARWFERSGQLADAVRHAAEAGDWGLAAGLVIDGLAIGEIIEPRGGPPLAGEFARMPRDQAWPGPQPYLVAAAMALSAGRPDSAATALDAAEKLFERLPADQRVAARLAAAMIRLAVSRRNGDLAAVTAAAARAETLVGEAVGDGAEGEPARRARIRAQVLFALGTAELWSGRFAEAYRALDLGVTTAVTSGEEHVRIDCLSHLALVEALRGRLGHAAELAGRATTASASDGQRPHGQHRKPAALTALAWVHLEHHELRETRSRLKQVETALRTNRDRLIGAVACLIAAGDGLAEGHAEVATRFVARARSGWSVPPWLEQRLNLAESRALAASGEIEAAFAAARRADCDSSPEAAVTLAHAWVAAGDGDNARRALAPVLAARAGVPERVRVQACLVDARLSHHRGDHARGRRSLGCALRLAEREQLRLPFAMERGWIRPVLQRDPELADAHQHMLMLAGCHGPLPTASQSSAETAIPVVEPLTDRELQVLRQVSGMLTTAEIATELYISTNTVKSHMKSICRKLAATHRGEAVRRARQLQLI